MTAATTTQVITHLSFTRLKELAHSPLALSRYIEKTFEPTTAMIEGQLIDCLLFTPDEFESRFFVMPEDAKRPTRAQVQAQKPSPATLEQIDKWDRLMESVNGRAIVKPEQIEEAKFLADSVRNDGAVTYAGLLNPNNFKFQVPVEFFYRGFLHRGVKDADGHDRRGDRVVWDLKRMGSRSGEPLVRAQIRANLYALQAAIYCHPEDSRNEPIEYRLIAVDNEGYVTPFNIGRDAREKARVQWNQLISAAHRLNMDEDLSQGPAFWGDSDGFFQF